MTMALEHTDLVPSEAPILITFVFKTLTPLKVATPPTVDTGLAVALNPPVTSVVQLVSE